MKLPSITDILLARRFLRAHVRHTPLEFSYPLSARTGASVFLKLENQQLAGSFKIRGAMVKMFSLSEEDRARGVVTASSGNHAQGVAKAAALLRTQAVIYVPETCPQTKREAICAHGGSCVDLRVTGARYDDAEAAAFALADKEKMTFVSAYEDPHVIMGQGTVALEMLEDEPELDVIFCPLSGGGLLSGVAVASRALRPGIELRGTYAENNPSWTRAWEENRVVSVEERDSLADALGGAASNKLFGFLRGELNGILPVPEAEIARAMAWMHGAHHMVIEGASATAIAGLLSGAVDVEGRRVGVVISGGNVDDRKMTAVLNEYGGL